jgi:hypothetical protein
MTEEASKVCIECQGEMVPIVIMDKVVWGGANPYRGAGPLEYHLPEDKQSFWTGKFPTGGIVQGFMCQACGRIALYAAKPEA